MKMLVIIALFFTATISFAKTGTTSGERKPNQSNPKEFSFSGKTAKAVFELMSKNKFEPHAGDIAATLMGNITCSTPTDDRMGQTFSCTVTEQ